MRKKVLHIITGIELGGGAENMLLQFLPKMQDELDNRVCVIRGRGEIGKKLEEKGIQLYYLEMKNIFDFGLIFRYKKIIKEFQPYVQVNYLIHADVFGRIFGRFFGIKKIVSYIRSVHTINKSRMYYFLEKRTLPLVDFVLTNSETLKNIYISDLNVKEDKILCIPNSINLDKYRDIKFNRNKKLKEVGIPENSFVIGSVARLEKVKDIPTLIKAFELFKKNKKNSHLLIIGKGSEESQIRRLIQEKKIEGNVTIIGKRFDMPEIYKLMDIFVLTSLSEGMSNALLEAMASGKSIITSDIPQNVELVHNGVEGLNFKVGKSDDLIKKIESILANSVESEKMTELAKKKIRNKYNLIIVKNKFKDFLKKI